MTRLPAQESVCRHCGQPIRIMHGYTGDEWFHTPKVPQAKSYRACRDVYAEPGEET